ncbi:SAM-dependent methyltransferase [Canicola haemoglobinophilus]|uniref:SAM-dependent methyltransferase n=1 Tax=Canicola haemoglobinophilus TaxID=733 RepID=A0A1V4B3S5_9PAST|nr:class I SAM-dependent methyltransferase [Canicola haemoglobinophilus]OOS02034.1 SAM-dependent methyltransferase [Canicola haemoglobinophilus]STO60491.1 SAM-dependent methyltransferase [Canicola haemoglobinophilus]
MKFKAKSVKNYQLPTSWQHIQKGATYCSLINSFFADWFPKVLGYQWLMIGGLSAELELNLPLRHKIILMPEITQNPAALFTPNQTEEISLIQADPLQLPFVQQSINACVLANTLNFTENPHQLLREITRVLEDDGYLFISLFNPYSPLIFKQQLNYKNQTALPFRQYFNWRVVDWLELLNFEIIKQINLGETKQQEYFAPLTLIVAQKRTYPFPLQRAKNNIIPYRPFQFAEANIESST